MSLLLYLVDQMAFSSKNLFRNLGIFGFKTFETEKDHLNILLFANALFLK